VAKNVNTKMRSAYSQANYLGSAKEGVSHWWWQRVTAAALVILALWFVASLIAMAGADYVSMAAWMRKPWNALLMILLLIGMFHHAQLGLQVILEDYVHTTGWKIASIVGVKLLAFVMAAAGVLAVLRITFGGSV